MFGNKIQGLGLLFAFVSLLTASVIGILLYSNGETTTFQGFAESNETVLNSETSVSIKRILVAEGDSVSKGQKLAELESQELALHIAEIRSQLLKIKTEQTINTAEIRSKILQNNAAEKAAAIEINTQIQTLENQIRINKELSGGLKTIQTNDENSPKNPLELQIESLKQTLSERKKEFAEINRMYTAMLDSSNSPEKIESEKLLEELEQLEEKNENMAIYAPFDGIVGSVFTKNGDEKVFFKGGEKISAYSPILSIINREPSFVKGYIPESKFSEISVGDKVTVTTATNSQTLEGTVTGLGGRIVALPLRLLKHPSIALWGREIIVKIPENNGFILGEKVTLSYNKKSLDSNSRLSIFSSTLSAKEPEKEESKTEKPRFIKIISDENINIEASGAVFCEENDNFLVVSDETEKKTPLLFAVEKNGNTKRIKIKNLKKINDLESIAKESGNSYIIMSSLSHSKKGKLKSDRKIMASISVTKNEAELNAAIDFYEVLENFAKSSNSDAAKFMKTAIEEKSMDIEGIFVIKSALFVAFKNPLYKEMTVIFEISNYKNLFTEKRLSDSELSMILIKDLQKNLRISDIYMISQDEFYFTASCDEGTCGGFFKYKSGKTELLKNFTKHKPEGIARDGKGDFFIFFDLGQKGEPQFTNLGNL